MELGYCLTLAVIPKTPFARSVAERARARNMSVLIHLRMESAGKTLSRQEASLTLSLESSSAEIGSIVDEACKSVPGAIGINNHMGVAATSNPEIMGRLMRVLVSRNLLFLDSLTAPSSVAWQVAQEHRLPCAR